MRMGHQGGRNMQQTTHVDGISRYSLTNESESVQGVSGSGGYELVQTVFGAGRCGIRVVMRSGSGVMAGTKVKVDKRGFRCHGGVKRTWRVRECTPQDGEKR